MIELTVYAIPFFILMMGVEILAFRREAQEAREEDAARAAAGHPDYVGYEARDTRTSLTMGVGSLVVNAFWHLVLIAVWAAAYELTPLRMDAGDWWIWPLLFFADDLAYYTYHRVGHEVRVFWASHVVHHSSEHYNLSTALRQPWVPLTMPFWLPLALLGYKPWMILLAQSWSLIYQFGLHTERIGKLPRPIEFVFNTPSHHRVHHGANEIYLDRNYGGILIIWDRLFGSFQGETERVRYGLTTNIRTFSPMKVLTHEYEAIWHDVRSTTKWRDRLGYMLRGPGWRPGMADASAHAAIVAAAAEAPALTPAAAPVGASAGTP
jgi:sterol desaturase/sphingolipid hydroxylase (fatty acid hydroxylase superfamily)